jgi:protein-tyrosine phosphatase
VTDDSQPFRVLHVCTGNICRSPMAERLMRAMLAQEWSEQAHRFAVESAGTWGHTGSPMEPHARSTLAGLGADGADFSARELVADHVAGADLVLAATREHRAAAVVLHPRAAARTFTLREFARLTAGLTADRLPAGDAVERARSLVRLAASRRGLVPPARPSDDDLADPYQAPASAFAGCADLIREALSGPVGLLVPPRVGPDRSARARP